MTDAAQNETTKKDVEENADVEDRSDDGSDIFMPGGITMKSTEIPSDQNEEEQDNATTKDVNDSNSAANMSIDEEPPASKATEEEAATVTDSQEKVDTKVKGINTFEKEIKHVVIEKLELDASSKEEKELDAPSKEEKELDAPSSPESCLEINIDGEESAFPSSNKEKIINSQRKEKEQEDLEERNIFMNIFDEQHEKKKGEQQEGKETLPKTEEEEHNMSDDFKIGLNQKSYEGDPFCPNQPRPYETTERNIYLIDK